jgi:hypothetical protein
VRQAGKSRACFPVGSLGFLIDLTLASALVLLVSTQTLTEMSTSDISWRGRGVKAAGAWD